MAKGRGINCYSSPISLVLYGKKQRNHVILIHLSNQFQRAKGKGIVYYQFNYLINPRQQKVGESINIGLHTDYSKIAIGIEIIHYIQFIYPVRELNSAHTIFLLAVISRSPNIGVSFSYKENLKLVIYTVQRFRISEVDRQGFTAHYFVVSHSP